MSKITYDNKVATKPQGVRINQFWDADANEIKTVVNEHDDRIDDLEAPTVNVESGESKSPSGGTIYSELQKRSKFAVPNWFDITSIERSYNIYEQSAFNGILDIWFDEKSAALCPEFLSTDWELFTRLCYITEDLSTIGLQISLGNSDGSVYYDHTFFFSNTEEKEGSSVMTINGVDVTFFYKVFPDKFVFSTVDRRAWNYGVLTTQRHLKISKRYKSKGILLSMPNAIPIVEGNRLEVFKWSIIRAINPDNYFLNASATQNKGFFYDRKYLYDAASGDAEFDLTFELKNDNYEKIVSDTTTTIIPVTKGVSPSTAKNILIIGDSFTASGIYPEEIRRRLQDVGGTPAGDGLTNINFIGTYPTTGVPREGYAGESWDFFIGSESPFWNPSTLEVDFDYYCTQNGYSQIDYVVILLGTNNTSPDSTIVQLLDPLILHNSSIRGTVSGKIFGVPYGAGSEGILYGQTFYGLNANVIEYNRRLEALINDNYSNNLFFADILPTIDIMNNMPYDEVDANNRNSTVQVRQGTNNVHPATSGYEQIADAIYNAIHYKCL